MDVEKRQILDMNAFDRTRNDFTPGQPLARRLANLGATSVLFYQEPIEMVSASGAWMTSRDGTRFLDLYNNVLSVGHSHPVITAAIAQQTEKLTINTRYLNNVVDDYLETLKTTIPASISNIALTCSGSEANDLALRVVRSVTGNQGFIVTENAYHGNTSLVTDISPSALKRQPLPNHVVAIPAPSCSNYPDSIVDGFGRALDEACVLLEQRGYGVAAFICDSVFSSDGVYADPPGFLSEAVKCVRSHWEWFLGIRISRSNPGLDNHGQTDGEWVSDCWTGEPARVF